MSFSLNTRSVRDAVVLDLSGRVTAGKSVQLLREAIDRFSGQGFSRFVMNLEDVSYIDSCGLGEFVASYTSICKRGGSMSLLKPSKRTTALLETTRLSTVFAIFDDEQTAVQYPRAKAATQDPR